MNRDSGSAIEKPRFGAPPRPNWITSPSSSMSCVVSLVTLPSASATLGSARTSASSDSSKLGAVTPLWSVRSNADFPVMMVFAPWRAP